MFDPELDLDGARERIRWGAMVHPSMKRRPLLAGASTAALLGGRRAHAAATDARPLPLGDVRLLPSRWLDAVEANRSYLLGLDPNRLLHNFRTQAGLAPEVPPYGGWESDTIAGHTLGHYLSALSLLHAQTGDEDAQQRVGDIVAELALVQARHGDGYVAGFTRRTADGRIEDGRVIFAEIGRGDIRSSGFDLNGAWSPLYNLHKTMAGLLDADALCGDPHALAVAAGLARFLAGVFARLDDGEMQHVLACEYGGLNESFATLAVRTGDGRWLAVAERIHDRAVLDPLEAGRDDLANLHANTQIPKLIGLARIREAGGDASRAPRVFWEAVTRHHSYVIGGNADREYFSAADTIAQHVTEQTCEHCNTYNMLKLTRALYAARPEAALFDFYERAHLNHVLAAHDPRTGMFTYMTPLLSGAAREWSTPTGDFWCCVGTGMESHAKHGDSIFWERGRDTLLVNLFIPARAHWAATGAVVELRTAYPDDGEVRLTLASLARPQRFAMALRVPGWAEAARVRLAVNGATTDATARAGYVVLRRVWRAGDVVELTLPMLLRTESPAADPRLVSVLRGPAVLAADLGPAHDTSPYAEIAPALVTTDVTADLHPAPDDPLAFVAASAGRPGPLRFVPFHTQYERRSAVYLRCFDAAAWETEATSFVAAQRQARELRARSVDVLHLGEMQPEHDHGVRATLSYPLAYRGRNGRDLRRGGSIEFQLGVRPEPMVLHMLRWSGEREGGYTLRIDGEAIETRASAADAAGRFVETASPIPPALTAGKRAITVRIEGTGPEAAGPFNTVATVAGRPVL